MNLALNVRSMLLLLVAGTAVSRAPSETCESLKTRLMKTFQERAHRQVTSSAAGLARTLSCAPVGRGGDFSKIQFQDCLGEVLDENEIMKLNVDSQRSVCFSQFLAEADQDSNSKVSNAEFLKWEKIGVLDLLLSASELDDQTVKSEFLSSNELKAKNEENAAPGVKVQIGDVEFELSSRQAESLSAVTAALQDGNPLEAFVQLYRLMAMSAIRIFNSNIIIPLSEVMQTVFERISIPRIGAQAMSILAGVIFGGEQAVATPTQRTVSSISGLIRATMNNNPEDMADRIFDTVAGLVTDLTPLRRSTVEQVMTVLRSLAERGDGSSSTSDDLFATLSSLLIDIGISDETRTTVMNFAQAIISGSQGEVLNEISHVFSDVLGTRSTLGSQAAASLTSIVTAVAEGNRQEAVMQSSNLHRLVSRPTDACQIEHLVHFTN